MPESVRNSPYLASVVESPVGLVVSRAGDRANAMTISFFSEVAHHPTAMWVSVARGCFTHELLEQTRKFTFVGLHQNQAPLAVACGTVSGRERNKSAALDLYEGEPGYLYVQGALSSTACRIYQSVELGDHTLYLAEMLAGHIHPNRATLRNLLLSDLQAS